MGIGEFIASGLTGLFLYAYFIKPIFETIDERKQKKARQAAVELKTRQRWDKANPVYGPHGPLHVWTAEEDEEFHRDFEKDFGIRL